MRPTSLAIFAVTWSFSAAALATPYRDVHAVYAPFVNLQDFQYLHGTVKVVPSPPQIRVTDIRFVIHARSSAITVAVAQDGTMAFPLNDALYQENPEVVTNQPKGTVSFRPFMEATSPPRRQFNYSLYSAMAADYRAWQTKRLGWMARLHMPRPTALLIRFPTGVAGRATIALPGGARHMDMNGRREIRIVENGDWTQSNPLISLDALPESIQLSLE